MKEYERILLAAARVYIESEKEQFLCCAVDRANRDRADEFDIERNTITCELRDKIVSALEDSYTFELYVYLLYGIRPARYGDKQDFWDHQSTRAGENTYFERDKFNTFRRQARLAWIDRMLENNEVK
jgi:hypothetical protein